MCRLRWLLLIACIGLDGCASVAAHYIEHPGHHHPSAALVQILRECPPYYRQEDFLTRANDRIAYWYAAPHAVNVVDTITIEHRPHRPVPTAITVQFHYVTACSGHQPVRSAIGSVVLLHPWGQNAAQMSYWSTHFSNAGYVTVMPALRDQGDSGSAPVGYGPREADDIRQLIGHLQSQHRLPPPLFLFGASYGATAALFAAPAVTQLRGTIALEPYVHPADVIERAPRSRSFNPPWWPAFLGQHVLADLFDPRTMRKAMAIADRHLGIDLASITPADALARTHACTLLIHGSRDELTAAGAVRELARRSPDARYVEVPGDNHMTLFFRTDRLLQPLLTWMQATPANNQGSCPPFSLAPPSDALIDPASAARSSKGRSSIPLR